MSKKIWPSCKHEKYRGLVKPASTDVIRDLAFDKALPVYPPKRTILKQELRRRKEL